MLFRCDKFLLQKSFFSRAHLHFPPSFVLSGTKFAEACFTSEGHQEGQLRQPEHFNKITLLQRINGEMLFFLSFSLFLRLASNKERITNLKVSMCSNLRSLIWTLVVVNLL